MPRDPYEVLGVAARRLRAADQEGLSPARDGAAPRCQRSRSRRRGEVQGGCRGQRDPVRRRAARDLRPLRTRGPAFGGLRAQLRRLRLDQRPVQRVLRRCRPSGRAGPARGRRRRGGDRDRPARSRATAPMSRSRTRRSSAASTVTATAPSPARRSDMRALWRRRTAAGGHPHAVRADGAHDGLRPCHGDGRVAEQPCGECRGRGRVASTRTLEVEVPAGIADGQRIRLGGRGHAGEAGAPDGDLYVLVRVARTSASCAKATT